MRNEFDLVQVRLQIGQFAAPFAHDVDDRREPQQKRAQNAVIKGHAAVRDRVMDGPHDPLAGKNHAKQDVEAVQKRRKREALVEPVEMVHVLPEFLALLLLGKVQKTGALERALVAEEPREIREEMGVEAETGRFLGVVENSFMQHGKPHAEINLVYELRFARPPAEPRSAEDWITFEWRDLADLDSAGLLPEAFRRLGTDPAAEFMV